MSITSLIDCPECGLPAQIRDRFTLASTAGPVEHVKTMCAAHHVRTVLADELRATQGWTSVSRKAA